MEPKEPQDDPRDSIFLNRRGTLKPGPGSTVDDVKKARALRGHSPRTLKAAAAPGSSDRPRVARGR
jgi:hypothetical protein